MAKTTTLKAGGGQEVEVIEGARGRSGPLAAGRRVTKRTPPPEDGATLLRLRRAAGLGQRELSRLSGVSHAVIARVEAGKRTLTLPTARALCGALGCSLGAFDLPGVESEGEAG